MPLLHAWQRDELGGLRRKTFDHDAIPAGWYDAPDKVPPAEIPAWAEQTFSARVPDPAAISPEPAPAPAPIAEQMPVRRRPGRPRKVG